ncbi:MAG: hypothetical protein KGO02_05705 [Alphaproteobacteria bacterium]|nr:hypothetical protein [Alphaproteobacteria bacterium]
MTIRVRRALRSGSACVLLLALCGCTNADWARVARLWEPSHTGYQDDYGNSSANTSTSGVSGTVTATAPTSTSAGSTGQAATGSDSDGDFCHQAAHSAARHATSDGFTPATVARVYRQQLAQCEALMAQ